MKWGKLSFQSHHDNEKSKLIEAQSELKLDQTKNLDSHPKRPWKSNYRVNAALRMGKVDQTRLVRQPSIPYRQHKIPSNGDIQKKKIANRNTLNIQSNVKTCQLNRTLEKPAKKCLIKKMKKITINFGHYMGFGTELLPNTSLYYGHCPGTEFQGIYRSPFNLYTPS